MKKQVNLQVNKETWLDFRSLCIKKEIKAASKVEDLIKAYLKKNEER